jgi:long-chain fatty acid transport protein
VTLSASAKIPPKYDFKNILYQTAVPPIGWQNLTIQQPLQLSAGAAFDVSPNWLVEGDVLWKDWANATTYKDVYKNQYVFLLGTQFKTGPWSLRFGYSYASDILRDVPNDTLGGLRGLGSIPLGSASGPLGTEVLKLVQMTLVPVVWKNTLTAGVGFDLNAHVQVDAFGAYALQASASRTTSIGAALVPGAGPEDYGVKASEWAIGAGFHFKY